MKRLSSAILVTIASLALLACGGKDDGGEKGAMKEMVGVMEKMADVATKNKDDCGKMAAELDKIIEGNKSLLEKGKAMKEKNKGKSPEEAMKDMDPEVMGKLMKAGMSMMEPMLKCSSDEKMKAVSEKWKKYQ